VADGVHGIVQTTSFALNVVLTLRLSRGDWFRQQKIMSIADSSEPRSSEGAHACSTVAMKSLIDRNSPTDVTRTIGPYVKCAYASIGSLSVKERRLGSGRRD
jgi:hypothetical protein